VDQNGIFMDFFKIVENRITSLVLPHLRCWKSEPH
jgi:hypothetical protein